MIANSSVPTFALLSARGIASHKINIVDSDQSQVIAWATCQELPDFKEAMVLSQHSDRNCIWLIDQLKVGNDHTSVIQNRARPVRNHSVRLQHPNHHD